MESRGALVVVADEPARTVCTEVLAREGFRTAVARRSNEALALLELEPFDLVVLDLALPGPGAASVLAALGEAGLLPALPVIAVGARDASHGRARALQAGAVDVLSTPLDGLELACRVRTLVELQDLRALNAGRRSAETQLRESRHRLELALRGAELATWDWDIETGQVVFDARWAEMRGFDLEEIEPRVDTWVVGVHPDDWPAVERALADHLEGRVPEYEAELRVKTRSGTWIWVLCRGRVFERDEDGKPVRMIGTELDITERKRVEEALRAGEQRYRAMIAAMPDLLFRLDREARFLDAATADPSRLALPPEVFLGRTIGEVFSASTSGTGFADVASFIDASMAAIRAALESGELQRFEYQFKDLWMEARVVRSAADEVLVIVSDITQRRSIEELLRSAIASRDDILAVVSHDLRSPLSAIKLSAAVAARAAGGDGPPEGHRHLDVILRSAERMSRLIDDLLAAATIEAGKFAVELASEDVTSIVEETFQGLDATATARSIRLVREVQGDPPPIRCDRMRIIQVLSNLIGNAIKVVAEGSSVQVHVWPGGSDVHFAISDGGPGIEEAELPHLFDRYWKGKTKGEGVGLGLYIAKGIVKAHGGRIWVESQLGAGSTFFFSIPAARDLAPHATPPSA
jgi:PAS domain S-box-containing protein